MTKPLSPTQAIILTAAAQHPARLAEAPRNLPAAARNAVLQSMLRAGFLEEVSNPEGGPAMVLRITPAGLKAVGAPVTVKTGQRVTADAQEGGEGQSDSVAAPNGQEAPIDPPAAQLSHTSLRAAATTLLVAWDAGVERSALPGAMEALRAALSRGGGARRPRDTSAPRRPREGTKQQAVLALLRHPEGTTIAQVMEATGWAQHTVRGFLAGLKKRGHAVEVLERVRQVGAGSQGAKGSYSVYRIAAGEQG
ncbi:DUF3489 domain-containing protein [Muricoccus vinaceus]|uniref:DUF3489 domain-containing protein n=1 Tax=Muricoccus vinaceus TaxID=424704 RepID=A0ABV6ITW3_9PROT